MSAPAAKLMPPLIDQLEAPETLVSSNESHWRAGVNRQARPDAQEHQVAAACALGEKRRVSAMTKEERDARRNEGKRAKRAEEKLRKQVATSECEEAHLKDIVAAVVETLIDDVVFQDVLHSMDCDERDAFERWMSGEEHPTLDDLSDWRASHEYECWHAECCAEQWVESDAQYDERIAREAERRAQK